MRRLHLRLFGPFDAALNEDAVTEFESLSARALLAYLAVERTHSHARATLAALLWGPDTGPTGLTNLRSCLRRVRGALGDGDGTPFLQATQETIQLAPQADLWTDVQRFETLLAEVMAHPHRRAQQCPWCIARLSEAVALYRGPFLADLQINSIVFEEWQHLHQERYHRLVMQALYVLADYHYQCGRYAQAEQYARRQLALEAWNEEAHQQLIRVLAASGQRSAALAQYSRCRAILAAELDVPPMPATTALYEEIRNSDIKTLAGLYGPTTGRPLPGPNNLPRPATGLVDRVDELDWLLQRLVNPAHRLTSLVGEGGIGKTRLALAAAEALAGCFADGVWFVPLADLAPAKDPGQAQREITAAVAAAVGAPLGERQEPQAQLLAFLRGKELLLVLDNFEHLLLGAGIINGLLRAAPNVEVLVTSRQPLNFQAEHVVRLTGLAVPPTADDPAAETYPAVALFIARARQVHPQFTVTPDTLPPVVQICRFVHGLPLGIELAAAWVREMAPAEIVTKLAQPMEWLHSNQGDLTPRHRTMQTVFEQSWGLLSPAEQQALVGAAIFRGGFDRSAARAVLPAGSAQLARLVDKSLLHIDRTGRYDLHELLRQFVLRRSQGHFPDTVCGSHSAYYLDLLRRYESDLCGYAVDRALKVIRTEIDNIRRAWGWAVEHGCRAQLKACASALRQVCALLGLWQEGVRLLEQAAARFATDAPAGQGNQDAQGLTTVLLELAEMYNLCNDAAQLAEVAWRLIKLGRNRGLHRPRAAGHLALGKLYVGQARLANANRHLGLALRLAQQGDELSLEAAILYTLGSSANFAGEKARAHCLLEQALARYRQLGQRLEEANTLSALSHIYHNDPARVYQFTMQRLELAQRAGSAVDELRALHRLAILWLNIGEYSRARDCCLQALRLAERLNSAHNAVLFLDFLGLAYHYLGDDITALRYLDQTANLCQVAGDQRSLAYALHWSGQVLLARGELTNAADCYAQAADIRLLHHQPHLACQSQAGLARVRLAQGRPEQALALIDPVVAQLDQLRRQDVEDPCMLWLNCYLVLRANNDSRAGAVLDEAHAIVQERATRISDLEMRRSFLHNIPVHCQIVEAWQAGLASQARPGQFCSRQPAPSMKRMSKLAVLPLPAP